jgi:hypothetical protein
MHGIVHNRSLRSCHEANADVTRIAVRYSDGRVLTFLPDAGRVIYSEDDIVEFKKLLQKASSTVEWAQMVTDMEYADNYRLDIDDILANLRLPLFKEQRFYQP